jgi:hypothetical protein
MLDADGKPFEALNIKACKQALHVNKNVSNLGAKAELGRFPMSVSIIISILKYFYRLKHTPVNSLLYCALRSQLNKTRNSGNTQTFTSVAINLASQLQLGNVIGQLVPITMVTGKTKSIRKVVKDKCNDYFILDRINALKDTDSKLVHFAEMKTNFRYENI